MVSSTLALLTRVLRVDSRLLRGHLFRLLFAMMILGSVSFGTVAGSFLGAPGLHIFQQT